MTSDLLRIPLRALNLNRVQGPRLREPVIVGIPLPRGAVRSADAVYAETANGCSVPMSGRMLDAWPDGSVRWLLCELLVDADQQTETPVVLCANGKARAATSDTLVVHPHRHGVRVDTGRAVFDVRRGHAFPFSSVEVGGRACLADGTTGLCLEVGGTRYDVEVRDIDVPECSPVRAALRLRGQARAGGPCPLQVEARLELFAASATVRLHITLLNPAAARHPGGCWVLGDAGSVLVTSSTLRLGPIGGVESTRACVDSSWAEYGAEPFEIVQESSGGAAWNSRVHCNKAGQVTLRYRGYRLRAGAVEESGLRASPVVQASTPAGTITVAVPRFWQNFPQAIAVDRDSISIGLLAERAGEPHEIQGGEQKTHTVVVAFGDDQVAADPLSWVHEPLVLLPSPEWSASTSAVPFLTAAADDPFIGYARLVSAALDDEHGFIAKRERFDEYGWRNFGDLPADHESAFLPEGQTYVSHYNNQYDALACFAIHLLRTADPRWHTLMCDLAAHVRDIDVYHTTGDKAAYNGGLFWHTDHYVDAGTSTHRTYPAGSHGGGPSNEHNYNYGFLLHYFLTGDPMSRDAAVGLGDWVLNMDDGRQTVFRWLAQGPTGLASSTGSSSYHGPGRGAANSIVACMVAHRLTGNVEYARKIDGLIRRCIHPEDDLASRRLDDVERRWYYTVFLQALGEFLHSKWERGELDAIFEYGRASLLHYSRYIAEHEEPYLDRPERLEFPTETWAAQDLRKAEALQWAAFFAADCREQSWFLQRAERFYDYAVPTLQSMPTHTYTRPTVLALALGWRRAWFATHTLREPVPFRETAEWGPPTKFVPQKAMAFRRAQLAAGGLVVAGLTLVASQWR